MKHINGLKKYMLFCLLSLVAFACVDDGDNEVDGVGVNRFRVPNTENYSLASLNTDDPTSVIFTVYRDVISNADLNQPASLNFEISQAQLDAYNTENETELNLLDPSIYTLEGISGGKIDFAAGEAQKAVVIKVNTDLLDFDNQYALPFVFKGGSYEVSGVSKFMIIEVGVKNQYDGVYTYSGSLGRYDAAGTPANDGLDGPVVSGVTTELITTAGDQVSFSPVWASGVSGVGGIGSPHIKVNPDNSIVVDPTGAAPASWGPIPGTDNKYDPETKTFYINYKWGGASGSPTGTTRALRVVLVYKGSR